MVDDADEDADVKTHKQVNMTSLNKNTRSQQCCYSCNDNWNPISFLSGCCETVGFETSGCDMLYQHTLLADSSCCFTNPTNIDPGHTATFDSFAMPNEISGEPVSYRPSYDWSQYEKQDSGNPILKVTSSSFTRWQSSYITTVVLSNSYIHCNQLVD